MDITVCTGGACSRGGAQLLLDAATALAAKDDGVVVQGGPFGSTWLRAGCIRLVPWHKLWRTLKANGGPLLEEQSHLPRRFFDREAGRPGATSTCEVHAHDMCMHMYMYMQHI